MLTRLRARTAPCSPEIADSWAASDDGLTWTFKIHPGMTWQDGEPLTASDVAFTFNYIIDNELSAYTSSTVNIKRRRGRRRLHGRVPPQEAEGHHAAPVDPHRPGAHLEQDPRDKAATVQLRAAGHRLRPLPDDRGQEGLVHPLRRQQGLLEGRPQGRRGDPRDLHEPGHHVDGPQERRHRRRRRPARARSSTP